MRRVLYVSCTYTHPTTRTPLDHSRWEEANVPSLFIYIFILTSKCPYHVLLYYFFFCSFSFTLVHCNPLSTLHSYPLSLLFLTHLCPNLHTYLTPLTSFDFHPILNVFFSVFFFLTHLGRKTFQYFKEITHMERSILTSADDQAVLICYVEAWKATYPSIYLIYYTIPIFHLLTDLSIEHNMNSWKHRTVQNRTIQYGILTLKSRKEFAWPSSRQHFLLRQTTRVDV